MKKSELEKVLNVACKKNQYGIIIYVNNIALNDLSSMVKNGNEVYNKTLDNIVTNQKETLVFSRSSEDDTLPAFLGIPVKRMLQSEKYFDEVLKKCNKHLLEGPFVLVPSNEVINR